MSGCGVGERVALGHGSPLRRLVPPTPFARRLASRLRVRDDLPGLLARRLDHRLGLSLRRCLDGVGQPARKRRDVGPVGAEPERTRFEARLASRRCVALGQVCTCRFDLPARLLDLGPTWPARAPARDVGPRPARARPGCRARPARARRLAPRRRGLRCAAAARLPEPKGRPAAPAPALRAGPRARRSPPGARPPPGAPPRSPSRPSSAPAETPRSSRPHRSARGRSARTLARRHLSRAIAVCGA